MKNRDESIVNDVEQGLYKLSDEYNWLKFAFSELNDNDKILISKMTINLCNKVKGMGILGALLLLYQVGRLFNEKTSYKEYMD